MVISSLNIKLLEDRLGFVNLALSKLKELRALPDERFFEGNNPAAAESYLRRTLESVFDIGRHITARMAGKGIVEYKEIAKALGERGIISSQLADRLVLMAGYRNRMVHFYHEISEEELSKILKENLSDIEQFSKEIRVFLESFRSNNA